MTILGDVKQEYCPVCGHETLWEYVEVELDKSVFDLDSAFRPETHMVHLWRCCGHMTEQGEVLEQFHKDHTPARYVTWETT